LHGWSFKIEFGRRIDFNEEVGQIVVFASFATKSKSRQHIFLSSAGSLLEFGPPSSFGWAFMPWTLMVGKTRKMLRIGGPMASTKRAPR
jgi:hypothetical protein